MKNIRENDKETDEFPEDTDNNARAFATVINNSFSIRIVISVILTKKEPFFTKATKFFTLPE